MIYFLYGPDNYRSREKLNEIVLGYKKVHKSGLNFVYFDAKEKRFDDLQNIFKVAGMFAEKKLVVIKNLFANKKFQEDILSVLDGPALGGENIIVIYEEDKVDERLKIFKDLKKPFGLAQGGQVKCQEFEYLTGAGLAKWLNLELQKNNVKMDSEVCNLLLNFVGNDLWQLHNEVIKLSNYLPAEALAKAGKVITTNDVKLLVKPKINNDIFKTIEALTQKNKKQGLHPFVVQKTLPLCNKFTFEELKNIYQKIFEIDTDIKTGKIDAELAIDMLVAQI